MADGTRIVLKQDTFGFNATIGANVVFIAADETVDNYDISHFSSNNSTFTSAVLYKVSDEAVSSAGRNNAMALVSAGTSVCDCTLASANGSRTATVAAGASNGIFDGASSATCVLQIDSSFATIVGFATEEPVSSEISVNVSIGYTSNASTRLAKIPFTITDSLHRGGMLFDTIRGATNMEGIVSGTSSVASDYVNSTYHEWDNRAYASISSDTELWSAAHVEYDGIGETYYLCVPFGEVTVPDRTYVYANNVTVSSASTNVNIGGYYVKDVDGEQDHSDAQNGDGTGYSFRSFTADIDGSSYYMRHLNVYVNRCTIYGYTSAVGTGTGVNSTVINGVTHYYSSITPATGSSVEFDIALSSGGVGRVGKYVSGNIVYVQTSASTLGTAYTWAIVTTSAAITDADTVCIGTTFDKYESSVTSDIISRSNNPVNYLTTGGGGSAEYVANISQLKYTATGNATSFDVSLIQPNANYLGGGSFTLNEGNTQHGFERSMSFRLIDLFGNVVDLQPRMKIHQIAPTGVSINITGSTGDSHYTGFYKKHGRFFPSEYITLDVSAKSDIPMSYAISGSLKSNIYGKSLLSGTKNSHLAKIKGNSLSQGLLEGLDSTLSMKYDQSFTIAVTDIAGNTTMQTSTIACMPTLYRTTHMNLREPDSLYAHSVSYGNGGVSTSTPIPEKRTGTGWRRSWNEIWYPSTHAVPLDSDGRIDASAALQMALDNRSNSLSDYDKMNYDLLALEGDVLAMDSDGRYIQDMQHWNKEKKYPAAVNSRLVNNKYETYWIIDNSGNPDFQIEFEVFDFNDFITPYPQNLCARYNGDSLSVFDASDDQCVEANPVIDADGNRQWRLHDSTKLRHLFTLKGTTLAGTQTYTLVDNEIGGELTPDGNGFTCPSIRDCSRICIVPFTDYGAEESKRGSGFKLKAGPKHADEYVNYEYENSIGEFWVHNSPATSNQSWDIPSGIRISYQYYDSNEEINLDEGIIMLSKRPVFPLLGTFSEYSYLNCPSIVAGAGGVRALPPYCYFSDTSDAIRTFAASQDDFVDYANKSFYVAYTGEEPPKGNAMYDANILGSSGRLTRYVMDNDTGIIAFTSTPQGRIFADYYHHTFYRLTSDGYGDLFFYGNGVLVPASTNSSHTDWTYVDLKVVNEGGNALTSGQLTFLSRGYITKGTIVDTVLDQNRPWDVQEGTTAETVNRTGAGMTGSYAELGSKYPATRATAFNIRSNQTCSLGTIEPRGQVFVRVFWCIAANADGTQWIECTRGNKCYSAEISGAYMVFTS